MADTKAKLTLNGDDAIELDVLKGTLGQDVIDIRTLGSKGVFTFDPGFTSTASCESKITYIDGDEGILLHRGFPIDQLATESNYLEVCYILLNGFFVKFIMWGILTALAYHVVGGVRHMLMDFGYLEETFEAGKRTANISFVITVVLSLLAGVLVW